MNKDVEIYVYVITGLLLLVPFLFKLLVLKTFRSFSFKKFIFILNRAFVINIIIGIILAIVSKIIDVKVYSFGSGNMLTDLWMSVTYSYLVLGLFLYLPFVIVLNLFDLIFKKRFIQ